MKTSYECRRCHSAVRRLNLSGRSPWYCRDCVQAIYAARIQVRNATDRIKRLARRDPRCGDCKQQLVLKTCGAKRDMHVYCTACRNKRRRMQDSRRKTVLVTASNDCAAGG
jgi:hypothetical protein